MCTKISLKPQSAVAISAALFFVCHTLTPEPMGSWQSEVRPFFFVGHTLTPETHGKLEI